MKIITKKEDIEAYYASDRVNQSFLKDLAKGLFPYLSLLEKRKKETKTPEYFKVGGAVDTLFSGDIESFENNYYISELENLPSDTEIEIVEDVFNKVLNLQEEDVKSSLSDYQALLSDSIINFKYYSNRKIETNLKNIIEKCDEYFKELVLSRGKEILSLEEKRKIDRIVKSLKDSPNTKKYIPDNFNENNEVHAYYQLPLYFTYKEAECKALLDMVIVITDENNNALSIKPIDFKTMTGYTLDFPSSARKYRYDIQSAFYTLAFYQEDLVVPEGFPKITKDTVIELFEFIVESSSNPGSPLVYVTDESFISSGINGERSDTGKWYRYGINYLIEYYKYLSENDWESERVVEENDGVLTLTSEGIKELQYD